MVPNIGPIKASSNRVKLSYKSETSIGIAQEYKCEGCNQHFRWFVVTILIDNAPDFLTVMFSSSLISVIMMLILSTSVQSFTLRPFNGVSMVRSQLKTSLYSESPSFSENNMSVDELKSELEMRGVSHDDCISKSELVDRLIQSRVEGKASPDLLKQLNSLENEIISPELFDDAEIMGQATSRDGNLPGGAQFLLYLSKISPIHVA